MAMARRIVMILTELPRQFRWSYVPPLLVGEVEMSFMFRANHSVKATIFHITVWATTLG